MKQKYSAASLCSITTEVLKVLNATEELIGEAGGESYTPSESISTSPISCSSETRRLDQRLTKMEENVSYRFHFCMTNVEWIRIVNKYLGVSSYCRCIWLLVLCTALRGRWVTWSSVPVVSVVVPRTQSWLSWKTRWPLQPLRSSSLNYRYFTLHTLVLVICSFSLVVYAPNRCIDNIETNNEFQDNSSEASHTKTKLL